MPTPAHVMILVCREAEYPQCIFGSGVQTVSRWMHQTRVRKLPRPACCLRVEGTLACSGAAPTAIAVVSCARIVTLNWSAMVNRGLNSPGKKGRPAKPGRTKRHRRMLMDLETEGPSDGEASLESAQCAVRCQRSLTCNNPIPWLATLKRFLNVRLFCQ